MIDKQILDDDFGGFEANDTETFALEQLTTYPGNAEGFVVVPPPLEEPLAEESMEVSVMPDMDFTDVPLMSHLDQPDSVEDIAMDDDFIRSLQQELTNKKVSADRDPLPQIEEQDFIEIDTDPHAEVIDLGEIKADHPSTFTWDDAPQPPQEEILPESENFGGGYGGYAAMAQSMGTDEPIIDTAPPLVDEKQKKKKGFVFPSLSKKTLLIAASVAGITALGIAGYMVTPVVSSFFADKHADSTVHVGANSHSAQQEKKKDDHHLSGTKHVDDKAITAISDSLLDEISGDVHHGEQSHQSKDAHPSEEAHKKDAHADINTHTHTDHKAAADHHEPAKKDNVKSKHGKEITAHDDNKGMNHSNLKDNKLHDNNVHETPKKEHKSVHKESKITKEIVKEIPKSEPEKKDVQVTSTTKEVKQLYTVQVYATPSKNEAERWLQKLRTTSVSSAVITTQQIRDKTWYRVRFGNFSSRDEAEKAIRTLGYDQCWIDRVR